MPHLREHAEQAFCCPFLTSQLLLSSSISCLMRLHVCMVDTTRRSSTVMSQSTSSSKPAAATCSIHLPSDTDICRMHECYRYDADVRSLHLRQGQDGPHVPELRSESNEAAIWQVHQDQALLFSLHAPIARAGKGKGHQARAGITRRHEQLHPLKCRICYCLLYHAVQFHKVDIFEAGS
jgi:hypothetical protein